MDAPLEIARAAAASVVSIESRVASSHPSAAVLGHERMGAGVAIAPNAILTAHYLVMGASEVRVQGLDGETSSPSRVRVNHESGLAVLRFDSALWRSAPVTEARGVAPGDRVFVVTWTEDRALQGESGVVTTIEPFDALWEYRLERAIMTTVINPGFSGAPLFDAEGRVAGVVLLGLASPGRYTLAVPIADFLAIRDHLDSDEPGPAGAARAWVGFYPQALDDVVALVDVVPGGPADRAGLRRGDLLVAVDGFAVTSLATLYTRMWRKKPGDAVSFDILRDAHGQAIEIVAGDRYDFFK